MTAPAILAGIIFWVDPVLVHIIMAIAAYQADTAEAPFLGFLMTGKTGSGQMCTIEREWALLMFFQAEGRPAESLNGMAFGAVGRFAFLQEIPLVIISMAISATRECQGVGELPLVAVAAVNPLMLALQRKTGLLMVEAACAFYQSEGLLGMALLAVLPETSFVGIFMAVGAAFEGQATVLTEGFSVANTFLMAVRTFHIAVFAGQWEAGPLVIETRGWFESVLSVAGLAVVTQGSLVYVLVASCTGCGKPEVGGF